MSTLRPYVASEHFCDLEIASHKQIGRHLESRVAQSLLKKLLVTPPLKNPGCSIAPHKQKSAQNSYTNGNTAFLLERQSPNYGTGFSYLRSGNLAKWLVVALWVTWALAPGGFVRRAEVDVANHAALCMNGRFYRCGAAKNFGVRIAALATNCERSLPDWTQSSHLTVLVRRLLHVA